jgi:hypothetical protein
MMNDLLRSPEKTFYHIKRYAASVISVIAYGHRASSFDKFWAKVYIFSFA